MHSYCHASLVSLLAVLLACAAASLFPVTSASAYWQYYVDDGAGTGAGFSYHENPGGSNPTYWSFQPQENNGYDMNTGIDCLEEYSWCQSSGTSDWATYTPGNSSTWWLCPHTHIAMQTSWSSATARYTSHTGHGISWEDMNQSYYRDAWYAGPNAQYNSGDYFHVNNMGGGTGSISVDMTTFHYNPNNSNDSTCS